MYPVRLIDVYGEPNKHVGSGCKSAKCNFKSLAFIPIMTIPVRKCDVSIYAACHSLNRQPDKEHVFQ